MQEKKKKNFLNWNHPGSGDYFKGVHLFALFLEQWSSAFNISLWELLKNANALTLPKARRITIWEVQRVNGVFSGGFFFPFRNITGDF